MSAEMGVRLVGMWLLGAALMLVWPLAVAAFGGVW